jgi:hypothetical protein
MFLPVKIPIFDSFLIELDQKFRFMTTTFQKKTVKDIENRFMTLKELSEFYEIAPKTLRKYLKPFAFFLPRHKRKRIYSPEEVRFIIKNIG